MSKVKLSNKHTIEKYNEYKSDENPNREELANLLYERFNERFISPILDVKTKSNGHGFAMMAVACLTIEAFQAFVEGNTSDTHGGRVSAKLFESFFKANKSLGLTGKRINSFYSGIRNGLIHDAETRNGWKINRSGPLYNKETKTINATKFLRELRNVIKGYSELLKNTEWNDERWKKIIKKFNSVVEKC